MTEIKKNITSALHEKYDNQTAENIQEALKELVYVTIQGMLESEKNEHFGYEKYEY